MKRKRNRESDEYRETKDKRENENQSVRVSQATQVIDEMPPLATPVRSLQEAARVSLNGGIREDTLFVFARALKAFEVTTQHRLKRLDLRSAFTIWWTEAKPQLPDRADFDEWALDFMDTFSRVESPLGANRLHQASKLAEENPPPPQALQYSNPKIRLLVSTCVQLQRMMGEKPFFLSVRDASKILDSPSLQRASSVLYGLVADGVLLIAKRGRPGCKEATRFKLQTFAATETKLVRNRATRGGI